MSGAIIGGVVRHVVGAAGAVLVAKGVAEPGQIQEIAGALSTLIAVGWSIKLKL